MKSLLFPALATVVGLLAFASIYRTQPMRSAAEPAMSPPRAGFENTVAAVGLVEPSSETVSMGSPLPGLVAEVFVTPGQEVGAGDPLFRLDDRMLRSALELRRAEGEVVRTRVETAAAMLDDLRDQLARAERLRENTVVSEEEVTRRRFAVRTATHRLEETRAEAEAALAAVRNAEIELDRMRVTAPMAGTVLQVRIRPGEAVPGGSPAAPLLLLGRISPLHVRVDVDEQDAGRVRPGARATGRVRGSPVGSVPLTFVRVEPLVIPRRSLTGDASERVDTRVLQAIYRVDDAAERLYPGQQMDVFIEAVPPVPVDGRGSVAASASP